MANVPISNLTTTWNNVATTFTGIKLNVTDTASAAASNLMDLQVGGSSKFKVGKTNGGLFLNGDSTETMFRRSDVGMVIFHGAGQSSTGIGTTGFSPGIAFGLSAGLRWTSDTPASTPDIVLVRDAAAVLAQRNGVNAQTFRLYNTFTDASNYERGFMRWNTNVLEFGAEAAGTGTQRATKLTGASLQFDVGAINVFAIQSTGNIIFNNNNSRDIGVAGGVARTVRVGTSIENAGYEEFTEMTAPAAPAANGVRIYAEDDGAGKTRLMARFATGAAVQIAIEP
jgi:hypothetical protein